MERRAPSALVALLFVEHFLVGAAAQALGLIFALCQAGTLLFFLMGPHADRALQRLPLSKPILAAFGVVVLLAVLSAAPVVGWSLEPGLALVETIKLCGLACLFVSMALWVNSRRRARLLFVLLLRTGLAYLVIVLVLYATAPGELYGAPKFTAQSRFTASFISANTAGTLCACLVLVAAAVILRRLQKPTQPNVSATDRWRDHVRKSWSDGLALVVAAVGLLLTGSRTAFVLCLFLLMVLLASGVREAGPGRRKAKLWVGVIAVLGVLVVSTNIGDLGERFSRVSTDAPLRGELLRVHWYAFAKAPWLGYGPGAFEPINRAAVSADNIELLPTVGAVHNLYVQWLEQAGLLGASAMAICLALIIRVIMIGFRRRWARRWTGLVLAISALFLLHGFTDYALEIPSMSAMFAMLLGTGFGIAATVIHPTRRAKARRAARRRSEQA